MSLKSKIEAVIYASEEPVTLAQLVTLLSEEAQSELDALAALQAELPLEDAAGFSEAPAEQVASYGENAESTNANSDTESTPENVLAESGTAETTQEASAGESGDPDAETAATEIAHVPETDKRQARERERAIRDHLRGMVDTLVREYAEADRGLEIREVAGGFRFGTKPEYHDAVRGFVKSLKPALKLTLQALETLAVVAYKQPVTAAEISEIRGVDSSGVLGGLLTRKLIQTAGRKQVIGRPMLYKTTKEFLVRFGLRDVQELPSMEEFERMAGELVEQEDLPMEATETIIERANARGDAEHLREETATAPAEGEQSSPAQEAGDTPESSAGPSGESNAPEPEEHHVSANGKSSAVSEAAPVSEEQA